MYKYTGNDKISAFNVQLKGSTSTRAHYELSFPSPLPGSYEEGRTAFGEYFLPLKAGKVPLLILAHGYGDASLAPCLTLARLLVRHQIATLVLYLPIHSRRLPAGLAGQALPHDPRQWFEIYRSAVMEIQRLVDWASCQEEIDPARVFVAGISLGGMISSIAMAVDARIRAGIFIAIGGGMEELSWGGVGDALAIGHQCTREECRDIYRQYPTFLREVALRGWEKATPARECFLYDPLTFAASLKGRPVLMINAAEDEIVPRTATLAFWEACGKPPLVWLKGKHADAYTQSARISGEIADFLDVPKNKTELP